MDKTLNTTQPDTPIALGSRFDSEAVQLYPLSERDLQGVSGQAVAENRSNRLTKYGKPARSQYRKLYLGEEVRDEHRVIMERLLGRRLRSDEVVHHVNGDQYDNRPKNLQLMSLAEHSRLHQSGAGGSRSTTK